MKTHQLAPGTVLGRYELLLPIASGGMATVWVARSRGSRGFSKTVAIKTILPNLSDDPTFEQMFLDEAAIASKIQHPNVAQIIDLGEQDEVLYLVMEWVDGESLSTVSKFARKNHNDIPLRVGLKIIAQACAGIHSAHELRDDDDRLLELVHRDVSPQNILVSSGGVVKIVDFGVAKALGRSGETSAGQLKGKVPFMSPEQAKGGKLDRRTDIFALGIILYRLATGTHPFLDENDIKTMRNIITRPVMPPRVKTPSVPVELERTILRALQKDPEKRHATAAELEAELEGIMASGFAGVTIDEVATFVRATLGERNQRRRAAIRDAALKMDESASATMVTAAPESLSGVMLTKTQTPASVISALDGLNEDADAASGKAPPSKAPDSGDGDEVTRALDIRASQASLPAAAAPPLPRPPMNSDLQPASSNTLSALSSADLPAQHALSRRNRTIAIASAITCGVGLGVLLVAKLGASNGAADAQAAPPPMTATLTKTSAPAAELTATPSEGIAAVHNETAKVTSTSEAETEPSAVSSAGPSTGPAVTRIVRGRPQGGASPSEPAKTAAPKETSAATPPPSKPPSPNVPTVQDPGF
ncbi:MAG: serine/threonine protein kinase [Polyangiaceae bacterium]|nr:serine/threonine protein kinase [Polyangiaceae bacterium]